MLQTKTIVALGFVAATGGVAYWALKAEDPHSEGKDVQPAAVLPAIDAAAVTELRITGAAEAGGDKQTVVLARQDGAWRITEPIQDTADGATVSRAIEQIAQAGWSPDPVATSQSSWERLAVDDAQIATVAITAGGDTIVFHVGPTGFARVGGADAVYKLRKLSKANLIRDLRSWRDRSVLSFERDALDTITLAAGDGSWSVTAKRVPAPPPPDDKTPRGPDTWALDDASAKRVGGKLDDNVPASMMQNLQALTAFDVADGVSAADAGLAPVPRLRVEVGLTGGDTRVLLVGGPAPEDATYVGVPDSDRVWTIGQYAAEALTRPPLQWRDKMLANVEPDAVTGVTLTNEHGKLELTRGDTGWKATAPADLTVDAAAADRLAGALRNLRGVDIVDDAKAGAAAMAKPLATGVWRKVTGAPITVKVGAKHADGQRYYVTASTRREVMLVNQYLVRLLLQKPSDLAKSAAPHPPM